MIKAKQLFILIGNDQTGKTILQKLLIKRICGHAYARLPTNQFFTIEHVEIKRKYVDIFFGNRSYQEKLSEYTSVNNYFLNHFQQADIAFISSHLVLADIRQMIALGRSLFYNITGIFWTNSIEINAELNSQISILDWDERLIVTNPFCDQTDQVQNQLELIPDNIVALIINKTSIS